MWWAYGSEASPSTGSSATTSASEVPARRTPLSAKARPFRSSSFASVEDGEMGRNPYGTYNPELQDYVYLNMGMPPVDETSGGATFSHEGSRDEGQAGPAPVQPMFLLLSTPSSSSTAAVDILNVQHERFFSRDALQRGSASADLRPFKSPRQRAFPDASTQQNNEELRSRSSSDLFVPVKRTFIHYDTDELEDDFGLGEHTLRSKSAPARLLSRQVGRVTEEHKAGTCKPCAYFFAKADGCRLHNSCNFCHLCPPGEIKKRKKLKKASLRAEARDASI